MAAGNRTNAQVLLPPANSVISPDERARTVWRLLTIFCRYRLAIALILSASYWWLQRHSPQAIENISIVVASMGFFIPSAMALLVLANRRWPRPAIHLTAQVVVDVVAITFLLHAVGGIRSGIGLLLLVTLAASGLVSRGRIAFFHAAIAALAILLEQSWSFLIADVGTQEFVPAGLLAGSFFVISGLAYQLASYAEGAERIAAARSVDLANLAQINELVIRDMQDGFIVVDEAGVVRKQNLQSEQLIGVLKGASSRRLADCAPDLAAMLDSWRIDPARHFPVVRDPVTKREYQPRFVAIGEAAPGTSSRPIVVFIEDAGRLRAEAQQMKLAALGRLTASIAHEIRNPLSSINHAAELLQEDIEKGGRSDADIRLLMIIRDNAHRLDRMVEEVLYLNRRDRAHPEVLNLRDMLERFLNDFCSAEKVARERFDLDVAAGLHGLFDKSHIDQILWNLLRNAANHASQSQSAIAVSMQPGPRGDSLQLQVADDGPGVAASAQAHLFEPFFTTHSSGTGLGLYIARELAEVNNAELHFLGNGAGSRRGACFCLTLQRSNPSP